MEGEGFWITKYNEFRTYERRFTKRFFVNKTLVKNDAPNVSDDIFERF